MFTQFILSFFIVFIFTTFLFAIIPIFALSLATYFSLGALKWIIHSSVVLSFKLLTLKLGIKISNLTFVQPCLRSAIAFAILDFYLCLLTCFLSQLAFLLKSSFLLREQRHVCVVFSPGLLKVGPDLLNLLLGS